MWWWIAAFVVSLVATYFLMPKPEIADIPEVQEVDIPTVEDGKTIPVLFGIRDTEAFNVVWWGDVVANSFNVSGGDSTWYMDIEDVHGGYRYFLGLHAVLFHGPIDSITMVKSDDKTAWIGEISDGVICDIGAKDFYGDKEKEGGFGIRTAGEGSAWPEDGCLEILMGYPDQARNWYLEHNLDGGDAVGDTDAHEVPAFRGVVSAVFNRFYIGNSPQLRKILFRGQRLHVRQEGITQWYDEKVEVTGAECNLSSISDLTLLLELDSSGSMHTVTSNGVSRFGNQVTAMKVLINSVLDDLASGTLLKCKIMMVMWGDDQPEHLPLYTMEHATLDNDAAGELFTFMDDMQALVDPGGFGFATYPTEGMKYAEGFFEGASSGIKMVMITSDGDFFSNYGKSVLTMCIESNAELAKVEGLQRYCAHIDVVGSLSCLTPTSPALIDGADSAALASFFRAAIDTALSVGVPDMNPAHIIRECLTDPDWGEGGSETSPDEDAFVYAADYLHNEGMGISIKWTAQTSIDDFIDLIKKHINAELYTDHATGKKVLKLIRDDYVVADLDIYGEDEIVKVENAKRPMIGELINSVTVQYWDTCTGEDASVTVQDQALVSLQGGQVNTTIQYPGFTHRSIAVRVATRDLRALASQLLTCTVYVNRAAENMNLGSVFVLNWPDLEIDGIVMRVQGIDFGDGRSNTIKLDVIEDVFGFPATVVVDDDDEDPSWITPVQPVSPVDYQSAVETPYFNLAAVFGKLIIDDALNTDQNLGYAAIAAVRPGNAIGANAYVEKVSGYENIGALSFCGTLLLAEDIDQTTKIFSYSEGVDTSALVIGSYGEVNKELMRIDAIDASTSSVTVGRGVLDTTPKKHSTGDRMMGWGANSRRAPDQYTSGDTITFKVLPIANSGELLIGNADAVSTLMGSRAIRPYPPADFKVGAASYPDSVMNSDTLAVTWEHRDRLQQTSLPLLDHEDNGIGPELGTTYTLQIFTATNFLKVEHTDISGTSQLVDISDFAQGTYTLVLFSSRDGFDSFDSVQWEFSRTTGNPTYSDYVLEDSPAGYWKLDETSGTDIIATVGSDGVIEGVYTQGQPPVIDAEGKSVEFTDFNSTSRITLPNPLTSITQWTVEYWGEDLLPIASNACISSSDSIGGTYSYLIGYRNVSGLTHYYFRNASYVGATTDIFYNTKVHVVCTWDSTDSEGKYFRIYINGVLDGWSTTAPTGWSQGNNLYINSLANGKGHTGHYDEIAVYDNKALSAARILAHYNAGIGI